MIKTKYYGDEILSFRLTEEVNLWFLEIWRGDQYEIQQFDNEIDALKEMLSYYEMTEKEFYTL